MITEMQNQASPRMTLQVYIFTLSLSILACLYVVFKPGISSPIYPEVKMRSALNNPELGSLASSTKTALNKNSSERTTSHLHTYNYRDGSKVMAVMVRVKKRDDFKIETYGLLTKNIEPIYIKNSATTSSIPPSLSGFIGKDKFYQTCIVPKATNINDSDFRLDNLTRIVESVNPSSASLFDKIMGWKEHIDYSCLVLTYKPANSSDTIPSKSWQKLIQDVQKNLSQ
ncbi:MAG: hypothetical protein ACK6BG_05030 [Cyanobacteriota bacterium]